MKLNTALSIFVVLMIIVALDIIFISQKLLEAKCKNTCGFYPSRIINMECYCKNYCGYPNATPQSCPEFIGPMYEKI